MHLLTGFMVGHHTIGKEVVTIKHTKCTIENGQRGQTK
jgi:hypothetical protein